MYRGEYHIYAIYRHRYRYVDIDVCKLGPRVNPTIYVPYNVIYSFNDIYI